MEWFKEELKAHWFKLLLLTVACVFSFSIITSIIDDLRHFLRKDTVQTIPNSQAPIFITPQGTTTTQAPPVYVSVTPSYTEKTTAEIKPKKTLRPIQTSISGIQHHTNFNITENRLNINLPFPNPQSFRIIRWS